METGQKRAMEVFKKIWNGFTTILIVLIVAAAVMLAGVRLAGIQIFAVLSGSMEPAYSTGSLLYVAKTDYRNLKAGDPITFMMDEDVVVTHRIVEVVPDAEDPRVLRFRTKGDANNVEDGSLVHYKNIIGKPVFSIPKLGYVVDFVQHPPGMYLGIAAGAFLLMLIILPEFWMEDEKSKKTGIQGDK
ncbi:MAG: signal peptidase I [Eubacteriales bacterium]|nr:signal peptidase I [Eubacteriales bacterium]